jgi:transcriptional regulator with XRE-family HTH domain
VHFVPKIVGQNIRRIRKRKGFTQETLRELAGIPSRTHLSELENGKAGYPQLDTIERIAAALDVRMETLLRGCP